VEQKKMTVSPEKFKKLIPELNTINSSEIGITLVSKETGQNHDAIIITNEIKAKQNYVIKSIDIGEIFINDSYTKKYHLYSKLNEKTFGIAIPKNGDDALFYTPNISNTRITLRQQNFKIEYKEINLPLKNNIYFKQEFIYNGRVQNALKFIYREYINDYARPAFTQELQYDLSESKIIGFRGLRIEILNASNTKIKYKLLNNFNK
jgi:hypothetical protein